MAKSIPFPLYALRDADGSGCAFRERDGKKHLLLFTSAEAANDYRARAALHGPMLRLKTAAELRDLLAELAKVAEVHVMIDPDDEATSEA